MQSVTFAFSLSASGHLVANVIFTGSGEHMVSLGECRRAPFTFFFSLLSVECVYGFLVAFVGGTRLPSFLLLDLLVFFAVCTGPSPC